MDILPYEMKLQLLYNLNSFTHLRNICSSSREWNIICKQNKSVIMANIFFNKYGKLAFANEKVLKLMGNLRLVKTLVNLGSDVHVKYNNIKEAPLMWSVMGGYLETVKYLVSKNADIHANDDLALHWSAEHGKLEVVKYLIEKGANIYSRSNMALYMSVKNGHLEVVKYLVEAGSNIEVKHLYRAVEDGYLEIVKLFLSNHNFNRLDLTMALIEACAFGHLEMVKYLYSQGADIWDRALIEAAKYGHLEIVKYLYYSGGNISSQAISKSIKHGHLKIAKFLINKKFKS